MAGPRAEDVDPRRFDVHVTRSRQRTTAHVTQSDPVGRVRRRLFEIDHALRQLEIILLFEQVEKLLHVEPLGKQLRLNLRDTTLVNQDVIALFAPQDVSGIDNCPRYIRDRLIRRNVG